MQSLAYLRTSRWGIRPAQSRGGWECRARCCSKRQVCSYFTVVCSFPFVIYSKSFIYSFTAGLFARCKYSFCNYETHSTFIFRCSVFKFVDNGYSKLGIGMLYVKEIKDKNQKSVLIRAATAIGETWESVKLNFSEKLEIFNFAPFRKEINRLIWFAGTVWLNAYITDAMKMTKADEKGEKMRVSKI